MRYEIAKSDLTIELERRLHANTKKQGVFCCFEVTIGWYGKERVDYLTYDTKGIWRCYEIKVSKADFYSSANKTFVGHFNYLAMPRKLFEEVKQDIPEHVGVISEWGSSIKKARKVKLSVDEDILKDSMIRSLARDAEKLHKINNPRFVEQKETEIKNLQKDISHWRDGYNELMRIGIEKYGYGWHRE